jgi:homogentisate 1,2-dioxygenase
MKYPNEPMNWLESVNTMCGAGDPAMKEGLGIHVYAFN